MNKGNENGTQTNTKSIDVEKFKNYIQYKAFDLISDGSYKKLIVKSKESGDRWAIQTYSHVQEITNIIKSVIQEINTLHEYGKNRLQRVCSEVISCVNPPCRRRMGWNVCSITGARSDDCIDLTRTGKSESVITVHPKFTHFLTMLWIVAKFEHVCKVFTRNWLTQQGVSYQENNTVREMCQDFQKKTAEVQGLYNAFSHAHSHVMLSIRIYKKTPEFSITSQTMQFKDIQPVIQPRDMQPRDMKPKVTKPKAMKPKAVKPKALKPKAMKPTVIKPRAMKPRAMKPKVTKPKIMKSKDVKPKPRVMRPGTSKPKPT